MLPEHKVVFVDLAKNASTSIKWLLAEITGEDRARFHEGIGLAPTPWQTVHRRAAWRGATSLDQLDDAGRAAISPDDGWFVFAVVRDPRVRAFSAWQSKFLVGNPTYVRVRFPDRPWLPRIPASRNDVIEDFGRFVDVLHGSERAELLADAHFVPQVDQLHESVMPYTRIYDMSELGVMLEDLSRHVAEHGHKGPLSLQRENGTPLALAGSVFDAPVREQLEDVYRGDLERFGHLWDFEQTMQSRATWGKDAYRDIAARVAAGQRIADLSQSSKRLLAERRKAESASRQSERARTYAHEELATSRKKIERLEGKVERTAEQHRQLLAQVRDLQASLERRTLRGVARAARSRLRRVLGRGSAPDGSGRR